MNRALFLDRDGVINEDLGYVHKVENFRFRSEIFDICRAAHRSRLKIIVVTNQAGIGRGYYGFYEFHELSAYMLSCMRSEGINISGVYCCPYHPLFGVGHYKKNSFDRKPFPGMLVKASNDHEINPRHSIMIGDNDTDREAASAIGILSYVDARLADWRDYAISLIDA